MNERHRETLDKIFQTPVPTSLEWRDIEALFLTVGARTVEGSGSRVRFELNGVIATFHRPTRRKRRNPTRCAMRGGFWSKQESNHEHDDLSRVRGANRV